MKSRTILGYSIKEFDKKMNDFLADPSIEVIEVQYASNIFFHSAMILYK